MNQVSVMSNKALISDLFNMLEDVLAVRRHSDVLVVGVGDRRAGALENSGGGGGGYSRREKRVGSRRNCKKLRNILQYRNGKKK